MMGCSIMGLCFGEESFHDERPRYHVANSDYKSSKFKASEDNQKFTGLTEEGKTAQGWPRVVKRDKEEEMNIEKNNHSACPFVYDDEGKVTISSNREDTLLRDLELGVSLHNISGHVQSLVIDSTKTVIECADLAGRIEMSDSTMIRIEPDNERGDLEEAKLKIKEKEKKVQELQAQIDKLKTTRRKQSRCPSLMDQRSTPMYENTNRRRKKPQNHLSLHAHLKGIKKELFASSTATNSLPIIESPLSLKSDSASPDIFFPESSLKFPLSVKESKLKRDKTIEPPTVQEQDLNWEFSELVLL